MSDCSGIGRRQATAGGNLPSQEIREANKAKREAYDPNDRVFQAPKKMAPKPTGNVCYTVQSVSEVMAIRNATRNLDNAIIGTAQEQADRVNEAKKRKKIEDKALRAAGLLASPQAAHDRPGLPKGHKDSIFVQAGIQGEPIKVGKVKAPPKLLGFSETLRKSGESRVYILPEKDTKDGVKQVAIMPEIRNLSAARGDDLVHVKCNLGAFLVIQTPFKEGEQHFTRVEIRHFVNVGSAHKAGMKAMMFPREKDLDICEDRPKEPAQCAIKYTVNEILYRHEILASEKSPMRDAKAPLAPAAKKPPNYGTVWQGRAKNDRAIFSHG